MTVDKDLVKSTIEVINNALCELSPKSLTVKELEDIKQKLYEAYLKDCVEK